MVRLLEQGQPCFQKRLEKHKHLQVGLHQKNEENIEDEFN
jgi:hypothetical protein